MPWFKTDDKFHSHPKVCGVSLAAIGLWSKAGSWCSDHLTDGHVTPGAVVSLGGTPELANELVDAGLWEVAERGWQFHDWHVHQPAAEDLKAKRKEDAERKRRGREAQKQIRAASKKRPRGVRSDANRTPPGRPSESSGPDPDPDPDPILSSENKSYPDAAADSYARTRARPEHERAAAAAGWLSRATKREPFSHNNPNSKHYPGLLELARKPADELAAAAQILAVEAQSPEVADILTPQHVADNWRFYGKGKAPGKRLAKADSSEATKWRSRVQQSTQKLEELRERRSQLHRSDPNFATILYDIDKAISDETEALERRKRELHALTG